ncbi:uncharacterized protein LOC141914153 [Tubulanus polymorphus]|uniref:uncharacterized protein LOC141914153 n=1 Tax=Tubulanus polymorphus TaxID=672921 RepID=UPI003DA2DB7A
MHDKIISNDPFKGEVILASSIRESVPYERIKTIVGKSGTTKTNSRYNDFYTIDEEDALYTSSAKLNQPPKKKKKVSIVASGSADTSSVTEEDIKKMILQDSPLKVNLSETELKQVKTKVEDFQNKSNDVQIINQLKVTNSKMDLLLEIGQKCLDIVSNSKNISLPDPRNQSADEPSVESDLGSDFDFGDSLLDIPPCLSITTKPSTSTTHTSSIPTQYPGSCINFSSPNYCHASTPFAPLHINDSNNSEVILESLSESSSTIDRSGPNEENHFNIGMISYTPNHSSIIKSLDSNYEYISSEISKIMFDKSKHSRTAFVAKLKTILFPDVSNIVNRNVNGLQRKAKLDDRKIAYIKEKCFSYFPCPPATMEIVWKECVKAIDRRNRQRLRNLVEC